MEKIYSKEQGTRRLSKACPETVEFLLNFSKSLFIVNHAGFNFESNLN